MLKTLLSIWALPVAVVSMLYIGAFVITFKIFLPLQDFTLPQFANYASILFLPHGVRVLVAWLYGWRAIILLAPGALLTHAYLYGVSGFSGGYFFAALFGIICATFSFWILAKIGMDFRHRGGRIASWRDVLIAGSFASMLNAIGTTYFYGSDLRSASAYFFGDLSGLLIAMTLLMLVFRIQRKFRA